MNIVGPLHIANVRILNPGKGTSVGDVLIREGRIAGLGKIDGAEARGAQRVDGQGRLLTPGLIDIHTHGLLHHLYALGRESLLAGAAALGRFGVTTVVPTIVPQMEKGWLEKLTEIAATIPLVRGACIPGLHLEGPFMAIKGSAAPTIPGDLGLLDEIISACRGRLAIMSLSPETPDILPVIHRLREKKILVFITHTRASAEQTERAIEAGAVHATHFYNVFYSPPEIDPGVRPVGAVEAVLGDRRVTVDFICDGIHVHPAAIRAAVAAKGFGGVTLITDSVVGAGLPPNVYDTPWGFQIRVREGDAPRTIPENYLSGSGLTMNRGIANLTQWLDLPPEQIWAMGTTNPARVLGLGRKGRIEVGADADLVLWAGDFQPARTWIGGEPSYIHPTSNGVHGSATGPS